MQFTVQVDLNGLDANGATLRADGNCQYSSTEWGTNNSSATYLEVGSTTNTSQTGNPAIETNTVFFDDSNANRTPGDVPIYITKSGSFTYT